MRQLLAAILVLTASAALAQTFTPPPPGATTPVNAGPGDQTDPHVSGDLVAYTSEENGGSEIRYHNLLTAADQAIPSNGAFDFLSDVNGTRVVFTRITDKSAILVFDTATSGPAVELAPAVDSNRRAASIGADTVAWQDLGFGPSITATEIVAHDVQSGENTRLSNDSFLDKNPQVSPDGRVVVWTKCTSLSTGCDIHEATLGGTGWSSQAITGAEGEDSLPDSNGEVTVYASARSTGSGIEQDIYYRPVGGGPEGQIQLPSVQRNPNISGDLVAFEYFDEAASNFDLMVYDLRTQTLYRLTETPVDESLNDISVNPDGLVRVVWTVNEGGANGFDVLAYSFALSGPGCDDQPTSCTAPGGRPLLATLTMERTSGSPNEDSLTFTAAPGAGLLCIHNGDGTEDGDCDHDASFNMSAEVSLNGAKVVGHHEVKKSVKVLEKAISVAASNTIDAKIAGKKNTQYTVKVYGQGTTCEPESQPTMARLRLHQLKQQIRDAAEAGATPEEIQEQLGCSSTGTGVAGMLVALLAVLFFLRPVPAPVRRRR